MTMSRSVLAGICATAVLVGCGSSDEPQQESERPTARALRAELDRATDPQGVAFPKPAGRTLQEVADGVGAVGPQVALATSVFTPGHGRLAFGIIDPKTGFVYGPTAVYVASSPDAKAMGPYLAPADLLVTEPPYRSRQAASEKDPFAAIYQTNVEIEKTGKLTVLAVTRVKNQLVAAGTQIDVVSKRADTIPDRGERSPEVETDTVASAKGNIESIDTRLPSDSMHRTEFKDVLGKKPIALLFATPALCESRVCGPVVDIAEQLKAKYGDQVEFIHQEVFVDNDPSKGLRKPLRDFNLKTEPWLFTIGADGRVAARVEGSFGLDTFERAVKAAIAQR